MEILQRILLRGVSLPARLSLILCLFDRLQIFFTTNADASFATRSRQNRTKFSANSRARVTGRSACKLLFTDESSWLPLSSLCQVSLRFHDSLRLDHSLRSDGNHDGDASAGDSMTSPVLMEVCVDSVASAMAAERGGAHRVELCSDLLEGGITPSLGLVEAVRASVTIPVHVILRPRGGDFCYSEQELNVMRRDIEIARRAGADGVALGVLHADGRIDVAATRELVELARPMSVTFHRAFDLCADLRQSLEDVCKTGADRLLTSGGEPDSLRGSDAIASLVQSAGERIQIMAGGGIKAKNVAPILRTGVREIHVGLATPVPIPIAHQNSRVFVGKAPAREYQRTQVLESDVRELKLALVRQGV